MSIPLDHGWLLGSSGPSHLLTNPLPYHCFFNTKDVRTALGEVLQVRTNVYPSGKVDLLVSLLLGLPLLFFDPARVEQACVEMMGER